MHDRPPKNVMVAYMCLCNIFPTTKNLLHILATILITACTSIRSLPTLGRLKIYLAKIEGKELVILNRHMQSTYGKSK